VTSVRSLKFCSYFPFNAKLCLNRHEYAERQLAQEGIAFEALDNGILSCAKPKRLQAICDGLSAEKIDALLRKWLGLLPHPFTAADRKAGYRYDISILQAEFSTTQVLDRPVHGRVFFEQVIRENLDLARPEEIKLIFDRRMPCKRRTRERFCTRVVSRDVTPSEHPLQELAHQAVSPGKPSPSHRAISPSQGSRASVKRKRCRTTGSRCAKRGKASRRLQSRPKQSVSRENTGKGEGPNNGDQAPKKIPG
jgi:hypothetical protein